MNTTAISQEAWLLIALLLFGGSMVLLYKKRGLAFRVSAILLLCVAFVLGTQQLWRRSGSERVVGSLKVSGGVLYVTQIPDGHGLNSTYLVVGDTSGKWKWYPIGNDDPYWYSVRFKEMSDGRILLRKAGEEIATFNPSNHTVRWYGHLHVPTYEGTNAPGQDR